MSGESRCMPVYNFIRPAYEWAVKKFRDLFRKESNIINVHNNNNIYHNVEGGTNNFTDNVKNVNNVNINNYGASRSQQKPDAQEDQSSLQVEMTNQNVYSIPEYSWVEARSSSIPDDAFIAGCDLNHEVMYVGRAKHEGSLIPGKVLRKQKGCLIPFDGLEHRKNRYEILVGNARWTKGTGAVIPPNAIEGGITEDGETLYIGRVKHRGIVTIGKIQPSEGLCYIPFNCKEESHSNFEILVE